MIKLLAVDPGNDTGIAYFIDGALSFLACVPFREALRQIADNTDTSMPGGFQIDVLVIEIPQVYQGRFQKGDPNDLIAVAVQAGEVIGHADAQRVIRPSPHQWKGTVPKEVHHHRLLESASKADKLVIFQCFEKIPKTKQHNAMDAYGLGRWALRNL